MPPAAFTAKAKRGSFDPIANLDNTSVSDLDRPEDDKSSYSSDSSPLSAKRQRSGTFLLNSNHSHRDGRATSNGSQRFQDGAIIRVKLTNFVTYDKAEFFPGPQLNMVIGPNGTGKSSLVCAICLGLGYSPSHLGRASSIGEFVKHGYIYAEIEIELFSLPENHIVRVRISKDDNSRKWWRNGRETTHKDIKQLTEKLAIQIDNLCQFLPQDKVASFAGLTPVQLLHETLRAAAPRRMLDWHQALVELDHKSKHVSAKLQQKRDDLEKNQKLQADDEVQVARIRETEGVEARLADLNLAKLLKYYEAAKQGYEASKEHYRQMQRTLKKLERSSDPALEAVRNMSGYKNKIQKAVDHRKVLLTHATRRADEAFHACRDAEQKINDIDSQIMAEKEGFTSIREQISKVRSTINTFKAKLKNPPQSFDPQEWNQKIREKEHQQRDNVSRHRELCDERAGLKSEFDRKKAERDQAREQLENLGSREGLALINLQRQYPDYFKAYEWIRKNQQDFEKEIFGPAMLVCSLKNEAYGNVVQAVINETDFLAFTCQTREDHRALSKKLLDEMNLSVAIKTIVQPLESFQSLVTKAELQQLGFEGFALDYIDGPSPVLAMLASSSRVHLAAVSLRDLSTEEYERTVSFGKLNSFAAGSQSYRIIRRREYGDAAVVTTTKSVRPGRFWTDQPVDGGYKTELQNKEKQLEQEILAIKEEGSVLLEEMKSAENAEKELAAEISKLREHKNQLQMEYNQYKAIPGKIQEHEEILKSHAQQLRESKQRRQQLSDELDEACIEQAKVALHHIEAVEKLRCAHGAHLKATCLYSEARSEEAVLEARNQEIMDKLSKTREAVEAAAQQKTEIKQDAGKKLTVARDALAEAYPDDHERDDKMSQLQDMVTERELSDIEEEMSRCQAQIDLTAQIDKDVLRRYQQRGEMIERLTKRVNELTGQMEETTQDATDVRTQFEPQLDELIESINDAFGHNFAQLGCAGEVSVHKDEDFEQWAIQIRVRFREGESLQLLNQHRQSGGERAVSTIFYLMSLQSMAQAPFRVVDEINQGMDPRNERMVHERMVDIACREHTSQYFLITPKLLTGLKYDEKMRVLCIASGEALKSEASRNMDFSAMVAKKREMNLKKRALIAGA